MQSKTRELTTNLAADPEGGQGRRAWCGDALDINLGAFSTVMHADDKPIALRALPYQEFALGGRHHQVLHWMQPPVGGRGMCICMSQHQFERSLSEARLWCYNDLHGLRMWNAKTAKDISVMERGNEGGQG